MAFPPEDLLHDSRLARHLGVKLLAFALWRPVAPDDTDPKNWQCIEALAEACGLSRSAAYVARALLVDLGWATVARSRHPATGRSIKALVLHRRALHANSCDGTSLSCPPEILSPGQNSPVDGIRKSSHRDSEIPVAGLIREEGIRGDDGKAEQHRDPRIALADAMNAQTERYESAKRASPPERMNPGSAITPEHRALLDRFDAVIASWPPGSPERDRAAACRPALPVPHVIESAIRAAGGMGRIVAVHEWAWRAYATGRLTKIGSVDASQALVSAFLGSGRFWQSILSAHNQGQPRQQTLHEWRPTPDPEGPPIDPETYDNLLQAIGR